MPNFSSINRFECSGWPEESEMKDLITDQDMMIERILENISKKPIGQVLKRIASLPEIRKGKVLNVRQQLSDGHYDLKERLDIALDKVLEDLTAQ